MQFGWRVAGIGCWWMLAVLLRGIGGGWGTGSLELLLPMNL